MFRPERKVTRKILSLILSFTFLFSQTSFAQVAAELNLSSYLGQLHRNVVLDKFRPLHLRYFSYDNINNNFRIILDKGDFEKGLSPHASKAPRRIGSAGAPHPAGTVPDLKDEARILLSYLLVGITLPNDSFWVNLRPDSENNIIDDFLAQTDVGKILLEADLQLKKDTAKFTSPQTPEGKEYWDKLYQKAGELFGAENITIPTLTRPWIVPGEVIIRESKDSAYVYKATLKVLLEQDHLRDSPLWGQSLYSFKDPRLKALNEYSSQLICELIIPKLTKEVNASKRYAPLRQVYYSLILARWFKSRFYGKGGIYSWAIDKKNLNGLTSTERWSKTTYFKEYQKSFKEGEYNLRTPVSGIGGQSMRSYFSGGIAFDRGLNITTTAGSPIAGFSGRMPNFAGMLPGVSLSGSPASLTALLPGRLVQAVGSSAIQSGVRSQESGALQAPDSRLQTKAAASSATKASADSLVGPKGIASSPVHLVVEVNNPFSLAHQVGKFIAMAGEGDQIDITLQGVLPRAMVSLAGFYTRDAGKRLFEEVWSMLEKETAQSNVSIEDKTFKIQTQKRSGKLRPTITITRQAASPAVATRDDGGRTRDVKAAAASPVAWKITVDEAETKRLLPQRYSPHISAICAAAVRVIRKALETNPSSDLSATNTLGVFDGIQLYYTMFIDNNTTPPRVTFRITNRHDEVAMGMEVPEYSYLNRDDFLRSLSVSVSPRQPLGRAAASSAASSATEALADSPAGPKGIASSPVSFKFSMERLTGEHVSDIDLYEQAYPVDVITLKARQSFKAELLANIRLTLDKEPIPKKELLSIERWTERIISSTIFFLDVDYKPSHDSVAVSITKAAPERGNITVGTVIFSQNSVGRAVAEVSSPVTTTFQARYTAGQDFNAQAELEDLHARLSGAKGAGKVVIEKAWVKAIVESEFWRSKASIYDANFVLFIEQLSGAMLASEVTYPQISLLLQIMRRLKIGPNDFGALERQINQGKMRFTVPASAASPVERTLITLQLDGPISWSEDEKLTPEVKQELKGEIQNLPMRILGGIARGTSILSLGWRQDIYLLEKTTGGYGCILRYESEDSITGRIYFARNFDSGGDESWDYIGQFKIAVVHRQQNDEVIATAAASPVTATDAQSESPETMFIRILKPVSISEWNDVTDIVSSPRGTFSDEEGKKAEILRALSLAYQQAEENGKLRIATPMKGEVSRLEIPLDTQYNGLEMVWRFSAWRIPAGNVVFRSSIVAMAKGQGPSGELERLKVIVVFEPSYKEARMSAAKASDLVRKNADMVEALVRGRLNALLAQTQRTVLGKRGYLGEIKGRPFDFLVSSAWNPEERNRVSVMLLEGEEEAANLEVTVAQKAVVSLSWFAAGLRAFIVGSDPQTVFYTNESGLLSQALAYQSDVVVGPIIIEAHRLLTSQTNLHPPLNRVWPQKGTAKANGVTFTIIVAPAEREGNYSIAVARKAASSPAIQSGVRSPESGALQAPGSQLPTNAVASPASAMEPMTVWSHSQDAKRAVYIPFAVNKGDTQLVIYGASQLSADQGVARIRIGLENGKLIPQEIEKQDRLRAIDLHGRFWHYGSVAGVPDLVIEITTDNIISLEASTYRTSKRKRFIMKEEPIAAASSLRPDRPNSARTLPTGKGMVTGAPASSPAVEVTKFNERNHGLTEIHSSDNKLKLKTLRELIEADLDLTARNIEHDPNNPYQEGTYDRMLGEADVPEREGEQRLLRKQKPLSLRGRLVKTTDGYRLERGEVYYHTSEEATLISTGGAEVVVATVEAIIKIGVSAEATTAPGTSAASPVSPFKKAITVSTADTKILASTENEARRAEVVRKLFSELFDRQAQRLVKAAGRDNWAGEHVDYPATQFNYLKPAHLYSMGGAIQNNFMTAMSVRGDRTVRLTHLDAKEQFEFNIDELLELQQIAVKERSEPTPAEQCQVPVWARHTLGVLSQARGKNYSLKGMDIVLTSNVPYGGGLSNSAANCCAVVLALNDAYGLNLKLVEMARLAQAGEHDAFVGGSCGLLDQLLSLASKEGYLTMLDYGVLVSDPDNAIRHFKSNLPPSLQRVLINTEVPHDLQATEYTDRVRELDIAFDLLTRVLGREIGSTSLTLTDLNVLIRQFDPDVPAVTFKEAGVDGMMSAEEKKRQLTLTIGEEIGKIIVEVDANYEVPYSDERPSDFIKHKGMGKRQSFALLLRRMRHQLTSSLRTPLAGQAAQENNLKEFGELINAEGKSLRRAGDMDITGENGAQDALLDFGFAVGRELVIAVYGRMEGGGGGGFVGFFVDRANEDLYQRWLQEVKQRYSQWAKQNLQSDITPTHIEPRLAAGAELVPMQASSPVTIEEARAAYRYISVSMGGNKIAVSLNDGNNTIIASRELRWDDDIRFDRGQVKDAAKAEEVMSVLVDMISAIVKDKGVDQARIKTASLSLAGPVDSEGGIFGSDFKTPNLPFEKYPLRSELIRRLGEKGIQLTRVEMDNDGGAALKGERHSPKGELRGQPGGIVIIGGGINIKVDDPRFDNEIKECGHNVVGREVAPGRWVYRWVGRMSQGYHPIEKGNTPDEIKKKSGRYGEEFVRLGERRFREKYPGYPVIDWGNGERDFEDRLSGPNIRARMQQDLKRASADGRSLDSAYFYPEITEAAKEQGRPEELERGLTPAAANNNPLARKWIRDIGTEVGAALGSFLGYYRGNKFAARLVLVSGINENLGLGVYETEVDRALGLDIYMKYVRSEALRVLREDFGVSEATAQRIANGIVRSQLTYERELSAYQPTDEEVLEAAKGTAASPAVATRDDGGRTRDAKAAAASPVRITPEEPLIRLIRVPDGEVKKEIYVSPGQILNVYQLGSVPSADNLLFNIICEDGQIRLEPEEGIELSSTTENQWVYYYYVVHDKVDVMGIQFNPEKGILTITLIKPDPKSYIDGYPETFEIRLQDYFSTTVAASSPAVQITRLEEFNHQLDSIEDNNGHPRTIRDLIEAHLKLQASFLGHNQQFASQQEKLEATIGHADTPHRGITRDKCLLTLKGQLTKGQSGNYRLANGKVSYLFQDPNNLLSTGNNVVVATFEATISPEQAPASSPADSDGSQEFGVRSGELLTHYSQLPTKAAASPVLQVTIEEPVVKDKTLREHLERFLAGFIAKRIEEGSQPDFVETRRIVPLDLGLVSGNEEYKAFNTLAPNGLLVNLEVIGGHVFKCELLVSRANQATQGMTNFSLGFASVASAASPAKEQDAQIRWDSLEDWAIQDEIERAGVLAALRAALIQETARVRQEQPLETAVLTNNPLSLDIKINGNPASFRWGELSAAGTEGTTYFQGVVFFSDNGKETVVVKVKLRIQQSSSPASSLEDDAEIAAELIKDKVSAIVDISPYIDALKNQIVSLLRQRRDDARRQLTISGGKVLVLTLRTSWDRNQGKTGGELYYQLFDADSTLLAGFWWSIDLPDASQSAASPANRMTPKQQKKVIDITTTLAQEMKEHLKALKEAIESQQAAGQFDIGKLRSILGKMSRSHVNFTAALVGESSLERSVFTDVHSLTIEFVAGPYAFAGYIKYLQQDLQSGSQNTSLGQKNIEALQDAIRKALNRIDHLLRILSPATLKDALQQRSWEKAIVKAAPAGAIPRFPGTRAIEEYLNNSPPPAASSPMKVKVVSGSEEWLVPELLHRFSLNLVNRALYTELPYSLPADFPQTKKLPDQPIPLKIELSGQPLVFRYRSYNSSTSIAKGSIFAKTEKGEVEIIKLEVRVIGIPVVSSSPLGKQQFPLGGIDFRSIPMVTQPMGIFSGLNFNLTRSQNLNAIDLDAELRNLQNMINRGIIPAGERVKDYLAACYYKNELATRIDDIVACLVDICKLQEDWACDSDIRLREAMVIVDAANFEKKEFLTESEDAKEDA